VKQDGGLPEMAQQLDITSVGRGERRDVYSQGASSAECFGRGGRLEPLLVDDRCPVDRKAAKRKEVQTLKDEQL